MNQKPANQTGIFQPQLPNVKDQSSSIIVQNTLNTPQKVDNRLIAANSTNTPIQPNAGEIIPVLTYGGVSVAVIIAMTWFVKILLASISELLEAMSKPKK
ncbi:MULTISPECIES: hypothetical protein [Aphanizomenonaceae]|jgi:hypothetical protein|uniref:hypothetical protein n=1 Tax=Aphanizomenonaceae TaxID=1892259 RepID=UPI000541D0C5|nr:MULTISPECIES: hypothetical protein [Aphanizomenonaceae]MBO1052125.1 hypothetical protein [Dolichospermum sp. DET73]QSV69465.1 MAG: hypothetical protein HEQ20_00345 [Aphanizomenon flos-aquae KM1D3_PB]KHG40699.1 hypothetical protein OA07_15865 [Aphanizomenon flos-aquae 2012/KM1/D3]MTJ17917.1 hypothetical protein [Dolichospermum sp. UHCC 0299]MTJ23924.1 hypothetical protein [Dolichospermum sp. UHCC 0352]